MVEECRLQMVHSIIEEVISSRHQISESMQARNRTIHVVVRRVGTSNEDFKGACRTRYSEVDQAYSSKGQSTSPIT